MEGADAADIASAIVRPRLLYGSLYVWLSVTGGRFLAPFLESEAGLSDGQIGVIMACQTAIASVVSSMTGSFADAQERKHPFRGRAIVLLVSVIAGSALFVLHGTQRVVGLGFFSSFPWHLAIRCLYAGFGTSFVFPVIDGLTLDYLIRTEGNSEKFGKERLHGAIWWAVTHLVIGPSMDYFDFSVLYAFAVTSTIIFFIATVAFIRSQESLYKAMPNQQNKGLEEPKTLHSISSIYDEDCDVEIMPVCKKTIAASEPEHRGGVERKEAGVRTLSSLELLGIIFATGFAFTFMFAVFCLSMGTAVVESLVFLFFRGALKSSYTMCSLTVLLTVMFEIPIFAIAPTLLQKYGSEYLLLLASFCYVTRVIGYSVVPETKRFLVLLVEPLHGITYACGTLSSIEFVARLMPTGHDASGQGLLCAFKGAGSVLGLVLGGFAEEVLGPRIMYRILAAVVTSGMVVCGLALTQCPPKQKHELVATNEWDEQTASSDLATRRNSFDLSGSSEGDVQLANVESNQLTKAGLLKHTTQPSLNQSGEHSAPEIGARTPGARCQYNDG